MSKVPHYAELIEKEDYYLLVTYVRDVPKYDALKTALEVKREHNLQHLKVTKVKTKEIINNVVLALLFMQKEKATN
ncbi:hypothetical protein HMPREF3103_05990 [Granulicatella sp. HMSC30F09]|uniref:hypothetical protein n=1 Tax=Granulicatella sp. HMSC30F09 TaxID=1581071 RepID=UPI0008A5A85C|nr:hypothetical protein [Granulicatella sp. HMSC30F09]OFT79505.1 hypothetical protein HMPREF3103_05990 [Granulicatella sp. HMSC30F09]